MNKRLVVAIALLMTTLASADLPADTTLQLRGTVNAVQSMQELYDAIPSSYPYLPASKVVVIVSDTTNTEAN